MARSFLFPGQSGFVYKSRPMRTTWVALICVALVGCGDDGGGGSSNIDASTGGGGSGSDAAQFLDAPPTETLEVTVSGVATIQSLQGPMPAAGVTIEAFRNADEATAIATTTTDAQGNYSITIETNGESIDGFLKASKTDLVSTYLYPPYPLTMDFANAAVVMVSADTYDTLCTATTANCAHGDGQGLIGLVVTDGTNPVAGATASSNPASDTIRYNQMVGNQVLPLGTTSTYDDGIAYLLNLPAGQVTVSATHPTMTFASHAVKAWANELTTTVVVP